MRYFLSLFLLLAVGISCQNNRKNDLPAAEDRDQIRLKRYQIPSGMVQYHILLNGDMGVGQVKGEGTAKLYFKDWGALELQEEQTEQTTEVNMFGRKQVQKDRTHKMSKLDNGVTYAVDFNARKIYKVNDPALGFFKTMAQGDVAGNMEEIMQSMGATKTGRGRVAGYPCDIWDMQGVKVWLYKGVPLKTVSNVMGVQYVSEAVDARFGIKVPAKYFRLPDYPLVDAAALMGLDELNGMDEDMERAKQAKLLNYKEFRNEMLKENPGMSDQEIKTAYNIYKAAMTD